MSTSKKIGIALIAISILLGIISYFILPSQVVIQISLIGDGNKTSKLLAILIPVILGIFGGIVQIVKEEASKGIIISVAGYLVLIFEMIINH